MRRNIEAAHLTQKVRSKWVWETDRGREGIDRLPSQSESENQLSVNCQRKD